MQRVSPVTPDHGGIFPIAETSDMYIPGNRLLCKELADNCRNRSETDNNQEIDNMSLEFLHQIMITLLFSIINILFLRIIIDPALFSVISPGVIPISTHTFLLDLLENHQ